MQGLSFYAYCGNNPVDNVDGTGNDFVPQTPWQLLNFIQENLRILAEDYRRFDPQMAEKWARDARRVISKMKSLRGYAKIMQDIGMAAGEATVEDSAMAGEGAEFGVEVGRGEQAASLTWAAGRAELDVAIRQIEVLLELAGGA